MGALVLGDVMRGIGAAITASGQARNVYSWPVGAVVPPCALVDWPTNIDIGTTFSRGADHLSLPVLFVIDMAFGEEQLDALSDVIDGSADLVAAIEGRHAWGDASVTDATVTTVVVGGSEYLGLKLTVDVVT